MWLSAGSCWPLAGGGALMSSVPWNQPTPHVQGDWHCPVPWHAALRLWWIDWALEDEGKKVQKKPKIKRPLFGSTVSRFFFPSFFFQKRVRRSFKLCFNHFAKVLSPPITCKAIVLLANSSSGAFIKTPPPCLMLMNPRTRSFLMILRKCSPLLSPSYHHLPCSPLLFFSHLSNSPLGF